VRLRTGKRGTIRRRRISSMLRAARRRRQSVPGQLVHWNSWVLARAWKPASARGVRRAPPGVHRARPEPDAHGLESIRRGPESDAHGLESTRRGPEREALGPYVLSCELVIDDLCAMEDEALRNRRMDAYARLSRFTMARAAAEDFLERLQAWRFELQMVSASGKRERIELLMFYTYRVHPHTDPETIHARIAALAGPEQEGVMQTVADQLIERGIKKGIEKGCEQEWRALLLRQLGRRFGAVPAPVAARVETAPVEDLDVWLDRILDAPTLDDVFGGA
jgi:hypothetical protein